MYCELDTRWIVSTVISGIIYSFINYRFCGEASKTVILHKILTPPHPSFRASRRSTHITGPHTTLATSFPTTPTVMQTTFRCDPKRKPLVCIKKNAEPSYLYVDATTLSPLDAHAHAGDCARARIIPPKEKRIPENVSSVISSVVLRLRAKTVRATYKRQWACLEALKPRKFEWQSPEVEGDAADRQGQFHHYIEQHEARIG